MQVILVEDVHKLGYKNDLVNVKNGFGRNYLIPQGLAKLATPSAIKQLEEDIRQQKAKEAQVIADARKIKDALEGKTITIGTKAGSNGKIFGSVTTIQITAALKEMGVDVDRKKISLDSDIKELGKYKATLRLHREVEFDLDLDVVQE